MKVSAERLSTLQQVELALKRGGVRPRVPANGAAVRWNTPIGEPATVYVETDAFSDELAYEVIRLGGTVERVYRWYSEKVELPLPVAHAAPAPAATGGVVGGVIAAVRFVVNSVWIHYDAAVAMSSSLMRAFSQWALERWPNFSARVDHFIGWDEPVHVGMAQMGRPSRLPGRLITAPIGLAAAVPFAILSRTGGYLYNHFAWVRGLFGSEFERQQKKQTAALKYAEMRRLGIASEVKDTPAVVEIPGRRAPSTITQQIFDAMGSQRTAPERELGE